MLKIGGQEKLDFFKPFFNCTIKQEFHSNAFKFLEYLKKKKHETSAVFSAVGAVNIFSNLSSTIKHVTMTTLLA